MGTTLTGTTPQDTYDSLIKVTDNGPIGATAKLLTDGLGNDSVLYLGTAGLGIKATSVLSFNVNDATHSVGYDSLIDGSQLRGQNGVRFSTGSGGGTERMRIDASGNVGIGTSSPNTQLEVSIAASVGGVLRLNNARTALFDGDVNGSIQFSNNEATAGASGVRSEITSLLRDVSGKTDVVFTTASSGVAATEKLRILADGGITFNGDTLAANALDDYEEGTFTATLLGSSANPTTPVTTTANYTKIGRQVTISIIFANVNTTGASGSVTVSGVPFSCVTAGVGSAITENFTFGATRTSVSSIIDSAAATTVRFSVSGNDTSFENLSHNAGTSRYLYTSLTYFV